MLKTGVTIMFGMFFLGFAAVIFTLLSFALKQNKAVEKKSYTGKILVCLAGLLLFGFAAMEPWLKLSYMTMAVWECLFWVFSGWGLILLKKDFQSVSVSGDMNAKQAGIFMLLGIIVICASPFIAAQSIALNAPKAAVAAAVPVEKNGNDYKFDEFNFKYTAPGAPWIEMSMKQWNPDTLLSFMRASPTLFLQLVAEKNIVIKAGEERIFAEQIYAQLAAKQENHHLISTEPYSVAGMDGYLFYAEIKAKGQKIHRLQWTGGHNGFIYQIVLFTTQQVEEKELRQFFSEAVKGFKIIDPTRKSGPAQIKDDFESPRYSYQVKAKDSGWHSWSWSDQKDRIMYMADYKLSYGNSAAFLVFPVFFYIEMPPADVLAAALLKVNQLDYEKIPTDSIRLTREGAYDLQDITYAAEVEAYHYEYRIKIFRGKNRAIYATAYANTDIEKNSNNKELLSKAIRMLEPLEPGPLPQRQSLTESEKEWHAKVYTLVGDEYFRRNNKDKGIQYYQEAFQFKPADVVLFRNAVLSLSDNEFYYEALMLLKSRRKDFAGDSDLLYQEAFLSFELKKYEDARKLYEEFFEKGKFDEKAIKEYLEVMEKLKSRKQGNDTLVQILGRKAPPEEMAKLAALIDQPGQPEQSLDLLKALYAKYSQNEFVRAQYFFYLLKYGHYEEMLKIADNHPKQGSENADVFAAKGFALAALKHYRQAYDAFVIAKRIAPELHLDIIIGDLEAIVKQSKGQKDDLDRLVLERNFKLNHGDLQVQEEITFENRWGEGMRDYLLENDEKEWPQDFSKLFLQYLYAVNVRDIKVRNLHAGENKPLQMSVSYEVPHGLEAVDQYWIGKMPLVWETRYLFPGESKSMITYQVIPPAEIQSNETYEYGEDMELKSSLKESALNQTFSCGEIKGSLKSSSGRLQIRRNFLIHGGGYSLKEYDQCRQDLMGVLRQTAASLLLKKKDASKP